MRRGFESSPWRATDTGSVPIESLTGDAAHEDHPEGVRVSAELGACPRPGSGLVMVDSRDRPDDRGVVSAGLGRQQAGDRQGREGTVQDRRDPERGLRGEADRRGLDPAQELDHAAGGRPGHRAGHAGQERGRPRRVRPREDRQGHPGYRGREHADRAGPQARRGGAADPGEEPARRAGRRRAGQDLRRRGPQELRRDRPAHGRADGPLHGQEVRRVAGVLPGGAAAAREDVPLQGPDRGDRGDHPAAAAVPGRDVRVLPQGGGAGPRPDAEGPTCRGRSSRSARTS